MSELSWSKVERLFELEELLRDKPRTVSELAQRFYASGIEQNTIKLESAQRILRRDLELLMRDKLKRGIVKSKAKPPKYHIPQKHELNQQEVLAVHTIARLFDHHAPSKSQLNHRMVEQLKRRLPDHIRAVLEQSQKNQTPERPLRLSRTLEYINNAWVQRRQIKFEYLKPGGSGTWRENTVSIYCCEISRTNLDHYVIGFEHGFQNAVRTFKLSRMREAKLLDTTYEIPSDFDPAKYLSNAWGIMGDSDGQSINVTLRFTANVIHRLEEGGYPNMQTLENHSDGSRTIKVKAGTNKEGIPLEILVWVRSFGPNVNVLEPPNLRELWLEDAKEILRRYE
jgi:predicted DNA-binding transcriptional regulator YafY